ncbi:MAG: RNA polymerase sigma factor [Firmicutes bacterium]|nr:RNA polymerase sigma factor [Bacillota bacterium]
MNEFAAFYKLNYNKIFYYLKNLSGSSDLAEELTQETFFRAIQHILTMKGTCYNTSWLLKIAHNLFIDHVRKNRIESVNIEDFAIESKGVGCVEEKLDLNNLLNRLPVRYKTAILLKDYFGFSYGEISYILNCSLSTVKITLHRARKKLKEGLTSE